MPPIVVLALGALAAGAIVRRVVKEVRRMNAESRSRAMKLVKTIPHLGGLPEIQTFYCSRCKQAETRVMEQAG